MNKKMKKMGEVKLLRIPEEKYFYKEILANPPTGDENEQGVKAVQIMMLSRWKAKLDRIMLGEVNEYRYAEE